MAFIKLQIDAFTNPKVRRLEDGAFRLWVYLLGQSWTEGPGKKQGTVTLKGIVAVDEDAALNRAAQFLGDAAGTEGEDQNGVNGRAGHLNLLENVGLVHLGVDRVGTTVGTRRDSPKVSRDTVWDITIEMHDWAHHNPKKPPAHTTEGEAERKRKYREGKAKANQEAKPDRPKGPKLVVPSVPTPDLDQDSNQDSDKDADLPAKGRLAAFRTELGRKLNLPDPIAIGRDPEAVCDFFDVQFAAVGEATVMADCLACASKSTSGTPVSLAWFVNWLKTLPLKKPGAAQ